MINRESSMWTGWGGSHMHLHHKHAGSPNCLAVGFCEKAAENGASGGCFWRPFPPPPNTWGLVGLKLVLCSCAKPFYSFESVRAVVSNILSSPHSLTSDLFLPPRPLTPKWTSLDLLRVMARGILRRDRRCVPQGWQGRGKKSTAREARRQRHVYRRLIINPNT